MSVACPAIRIACELLHQGVVLATDAASSQKPPFVFGKQDARRARYTFASLKSGSHISLFSFGVPKNLLLQGFISLLSDFPLLLQPVDMIGLSHYLQGAKYMSGVLVSGISDPSTVC